MPQLKVIGPTTNTQFPTTNPAQLDAGIGGATRELGQAFSQLGDMVDQVGKARAEQAALRADQEVQNLALEYQKNPNLLLDPEWTDRFDEQVSVIQDKYGQSPLMRKDTFNARFGTMAGNRKLAVGAQAIQHTLKAGSDAFDSNLQDYRSKRALATSPEERAFYTSEMQRITAEAVQGGFKTPGTGDIMLREALSDSVVDRYNARLYSDNPASAVEVLNEDQGFLTAEAVAKLSKLAWEREGEVVQRSWAEHRFAVSEQKRVDKIRSDAAVSAVIAGSLRPGGMSLEEARPFLDDMSTEDKKWFERHFRDNPNGKVDQSAKIDDHQSLVRLSTRLFGGNVDDPDEEPFTVALYKDFAEKRITYNTFSNMMKDYEKREVYPFSDVVAKAVNEIVFLDGDRDSKMFEARLRYNEWNRNNPGASTQDRLAQVKSIVAQFDEYGLAGLSGKPLPEYFQFDDSQKFSRDLSIEAVVRDFEAGRIDRDEMARRRDAVISFEASEKARIMVESAK